MPEEKFERQKELDIAMEKLRETYSGKYKVKVAFWRMKLRGNGDIRKTKTLKFASPEIEKAFWDGFACATYEWDSWSDIQGSKVYKDGTDENTCNYPENQYA